MARETIYPSNPGAEPYRPVPTIVWERERLVQIATRMSMDEHDDGARWADLDRQQINRLIAVLRRARDSAFGADE